MGAAAAALVCNNFSPIRWKISFHMKKKSPYCSPISKLIQSIKTFLTFELSQYLQPRLSLPRKRLVTPVFVLARQTRPGHSIEWRGCSYRAYYREKALRQLSDSTSCRLLDIARKTKSVRKELLNSIGLSGTVGSACHHSRRLAWHLGSQARQALASSC